jgi:hypothetical protein
LILVRKENMSMAIKYKAEPGQEFDRICITGGLYQDENGRYFFFILPTDEEGSFFGEGVKIPASDKDMNRILTDKRELGFPLFRSKYDKFIINRE